MAASASELRDILSLPQASQAAAVKPRKPLASTSTRKPEGITRELFSLIGDAAPSLAAQYAKPRFKQKPDLGRAKVKWEWREFNNTARTDNLKLSHWVKASINPAAEYPFAQYNTANQVYSYTDEEYEKELQDPDWSREETDYLFSIVRDFDMRFIVVADRYEFPAGTPRSLEDIKWRYYGVCRKLIQSRPWTGPEASKTQLLASYQFDKDRELQRKARVLKLLDRTPEQIAEEESLYLEIKRLEQTERRFAKERDELLLTLGGIQSGLSGIRVDDEVMGNIFGADSGGGIGSNNNMMSNKKRNKRGRAGTEASELDSPIPSNSMSISLNGPKKMSSAKQAAFDLANCITRTEFANGAPIKSAHQPVLLRSQKFPDPKPTNASRTSQILKELGIVMTRLVMPTTENLQGMEQLQKTAGSLIELKRVVDRVDQEIRIVKERLGIAADDDEENEGEGNNGSEENGGKDGDKDVDVEMADEAAATTAAGEEKDADGTPDEEVTPATTTPAPAMGTRPRSRSSARRSTKRSMSVSSTESTTPVATRGNPKRLRNV